MNGQHGVVLRENGNLPSGPTVQGTICLKLGNLPKIG
jgi:hypothetical protein